MSQQEPGWGSPEGQPVQPAYGPSASSPEQQPAPVYGTPAGPPGPYGVRPALPQNSLAVWSLVLGVVGFFLVSAFGLGLVPGIIAIVLGVKGHKAVRAGLADNGGLATAGIVLGSLAALGGVLVAGFFGLFWFLDAVQFGYG
ncbi:DUF4190 domain-containing protein [Antribacter gilvus]|uniref:DUF4190 domain-containing protein n=1 Tax=Antribacter gilvus TaxID=2304675 RepID=UPI000F7ACD17|nr:DUF4190 domain-containing protein [Antribacter gilvus]